MNDSLDKFKIVKNETIKSLEIIELQKSVLLQTTKHLPMRKSSLYVFAEEESQMAQTKEVRKTDMNLFSPD